MIGETIEYGDKVGVLCQFLGTDVGSVRAVIRIDDRYLFVPIDDIRKTDKPIEKIQPPKKAKKKSRKILKSLT